MKKTVLTTLLAFCLSMSLAQEEKVQSNNINEPRHEVSLSVGDNMFQTQIFDEAEKGFGSYTVSYHYRIKNWFWIGGCINVSPVKQIDYNYNYDYSSNYEYKTLLTTRMSLAPSVRFSYYNKPKVTLYSALALGWGLSVDNKGEQNLIFYYQTTFFGFSVGRKFFAGGEIGIGYKGLFCVNLGYRF